jgi:hypothetical protein
LNFQSLAGKTLNSQLLHDLSQTIRETLQKSDASILDLSAWLDRLQSSTDRQSVMKFVIEIGAM